MDEKIMVEVAYAQPDEQLIVEVMVEPETTVEQAVEASGILNRFPDIEFDSVKLGIFGKNVRRDRVLQDRDRVEIYRPLIADPKEVRRQRAAAGKKMKKGGG